MEIILQGDLSFTKIEVVVSMVRQDLVPVTVPLCLVALVKPLVHSMRIPLLLTPGVLGRYRLHRVLRIDIHFAVRL